MLSELLSPGHQAEDGVDAGPMPAATPPPTSDAGWRKTCGCGHSMEAHAHYRRGTDCALCGCPRFANRIRAALTRRSR